jgi:glycosyltransferase 2 family protein
MLGMPALRSKKLLLSYLAGAVLLYFFFRNTDWQSIRTGMRSVAWPLLLAAVVLRIAALVAASLRWRELLLPVRTVRLQPIVAATMIGMAVNTAVSMQAAEFVRPYVLSTSERLDFSSVMSTIMVEWVFDAFAILALFIPALALRATPGIRSQAALANLNQAIGLVLLVSMAGLAVLWCVHRYSAEIDRFFAREHRFLPVRIRTVLSDQVRHFATGLNILRQPLGLAAVSVYSLLVSLLTALSCWLALAAFGLSLPVASAFIVLGLISVGGMVPTPGAVGGFHAICQLGLVIFFKVDAARAVLPVIGMHAVLYLPPAVLGLLYILNYSRQGRRAVI